MAKGFVLNFVGSPPRRCSGFAIAAVFAGIFRLPRSIYLVAYLALAAPFLYGFARWSNLSIGSLIRHNWVWGLVAAVLVGAFTVRNILSQPASPHSQGLSLALDIAWLGVVYGALDALFLSVLPVLATWQAFSALGWTHTLAGKILVGAIALIASLLVTVAYHLGYPEYRVGGGVMGPSHRKRCDEFWLHPDQQPHRRGLQPHRHAHRGCLARSRHGDAAPAALLKYDPHRSCGRSIRMTGDHRKRLYGTNQKPKVCHVLSNFPRKDFRACVSNPEQSKPTGLHDPLDEDAAHPLPPWPGLDAR